MSTYDEKMDGMIEIEGAGDVAPFASYTIERVPPNLGLRPFVKLRFWSYPSIFEIGLNTRSLDDLIDLLIRAQADLSSAQVRK
jgi:hypothetical protein